jgi:hypothetical protein
MIGRRMANIIKRFAKAIANELIAPEPGLACGSSPSQQPMLGCGAWRSEVEIEHEAYY